MAKTNKSIPKRMVITKAGKILARGVGFNHFRAKQTRQNQLHKKRWRSVNEKTVKLLTSYIQH